MSGHNQRLRAGTPLFDPEAFRCWRLVEALPARLRGVRVLDARAAVVDARLDGHLHPETTVVCCIAGATRVETARGGVDLAVGEALVVAPGAWHRHSVLRRDSAVFAQGLMGRRSDVLLATAERRWHVAVPEEPSRGLLARALGAGDAGRRHAIAELAANFAREPATALTMSAEQIAMGHFLWSNFTRPITAADVLRASGLARAQAHARFQEAHGEPPKRALTRCRLALAERLSAEGLQDAEIAARSGFASAACLRRVRKAWRA